MKKLAPKNIQIVYTGNKKTDENAEIFDDFLSNIDEFQQKFDINNKEQTGKVKSQQSIQVVDIKQLKKKQKGLFEIWKRWKLYRNF